MSERQVLLPAEGMVGNLGRIDKILAEQDKREILDQRYGQRGFVRIVCDPRFSEDIPTSIWCFIQETRKVLPSFAYSAFENDGYYYLENEDAEKQLDIFQDKRGDGIVSLTIQTKGTDFDLQIFLYDKNWQNGGGIAILNATSPHPTIDLAVRGEPGRQKINGFLDPNISRAGRRTIRDVFRFLQIPSVSRLSDRKAA